MIPAPFNVDTIVRVRPARISDHGRLIADWDAPPAVPDLPIAGCSVQPGAPDEETANRESITVRWTVYAPPAADVTGLDGVRWQGTIYQVEGDPQRWPDFGGLGHQVILLVDREG